MPLVAFGFVLTFTATSLFNFTLGQPVMARKTLDSGRGQCIVVDKLRYWKAGFTYKEDI